MISTDTADDIAKFLPRLASEYDSEVTAAVRVISRRLAAAGNDWHDLAHIVVEGAKAEADPFGLSPSPYATTATAQETAPRDEDRKAPDGRDAPDAPAQTLGMKIWGDDDDDDMSPWTIVAHEARMRDWCLPKARGGRFLTKAERNRLKAWEGGAGLTNADAAWLALVFDRLNAAQRYHPREKASS